MAAMLSIKQNTLSRYERCERPIPYRIIYNFMCLADINILLTSNNTYDIIFNTNNNT